MNVKKNFAASEKKNLVHVCPIRRVTRVVQGGKIMRFSALVITGDGKGKVGYASAKSVEVAEAIRKASKAAEKNMITVPFKDGRTIHHDVYVKLGASTIMIKKAPVGAGNISGGSMRFIFEALGLRDVVAKSFGSNNPYSVVRATFKALQSISTPRRLAKIRNVALDKVIDYQQNVVSAAPAA